MPKFMILDLPISAFCDHPFLYKLQQIRMSGESALPLISYCYTPLSYSCTDHSQPVILSFLLSEVDCFCALLNENILQSHLIYFMLPKIVEFCCKSSSMLLIL
jgi:hypothetical protein